MIFLKYVYYIFKKILLYINNYKKCSYSENVLNIHRAVQNIASSKNMKIQIWF